MDKFVKYWKKGWRVWLALICINFSYLMLFTAIRILCILISGGKDFPMGFYYFISFLIGVAVMPVLTYWIFIRFYPKAH